MRRARRCCCLGTGVAIAGASLIAAPVVSPAPHVEVRDVQLTSGDAADSPLGDGTALVIGGSGIPIPPQSYVDAADTLYLQPRDFTGTPQALDTPEGFYPTTGVNSLTADASEAQGAQILDGAITGQIAGGNVDAANPVVVFGYSQSSANALTTALPAYDASLSVDQLEAGNLLGAIGDPIAADVALIPFAIFLGAGPITDAVEGTLLNIADLIP
jgi:hypothetical protein